MKTRITSTKQSLFRTVGILGLFLFLFAGVNSVEAQTTTEREVSGVIKDSEGPVLGAAISLKGSSIGTITDENGAFTFPSLLKGERCFNN